MKKGERTWKFQELGKKLDQLAEKIRGRTQEEAEKTGVEIKEWGKRLDELGKKLKTTTQEGIEKFAGETKGLLKSAKLRSEVKETERRVESLFKELGERTYQLHREKKIGNVQLKKLGGKITQLRKEMEQKEKEIETLREK